MFLVFVWVVVCVCVYNYVYVCVYVCVCVSVCVCVGLQRALYLITQEALQLISSIYFIDGNNKYYGIPGNIMSL